MVLRSMFLLAQILKLIDLVEKAMMQKILLFTVMKVEK